MLLRDLTIENYRSFEKYRLDNLARVNILVGDNNCGKTSVLEAVNLLLSGGNIGVLYSFLEARGEATPIPHTSPSEQPKHFYHVRSLFSGGDSEFSTAAKHTVIRLAGRFDESKGSHIAGTIQAPSVNSRSELEFHGRGPHGQSFSSSAPLDQFGRIIGQHHVASAMMSGNLLSISPECQFIPATAVEISNLNAVWNATQRHQRETLVVAALRFMIPGVRDIRFQPETESRHDILVDLSNKRVPLSTLGDGASRVLMIAASLAASKGEFLLVDEVDTGIHYSNLANLWEMVIFAAKDLDVQVFATTHSLDCIRGLAEAVERDAAFTDDVAIFRIERPGEQAVRFGGEELRVVIENEIEVR